MGNRHSKSSDSHEARLAEDGNEKTDVNNFIGVFYKIKSSGNVSINANGSTVSSSKEPQASPWSSTQRDDNNGNHAIDYGQHSIERTNEGEMIQRREPSFVGDQSQQRPREYSHSTRYPANIVNRTI
ncbi:hypothetical protein GCK72_007358 [Caenorhabditis remanei]|uniref:Uncharacterized protein n=1 Tax=Caenorhabditis remanei TaxID=31234 RepID=A0A6A5HIY5_CAERE|nr:hypothetical protein GCK72_007358 [Caenorhabditis remanei]KAF1767399.1 hypothetical protein GCK72_007358 [Caenorhabditis remanei]